MPKTHRIIYIEDFRIHIDELISAIYKPVMVKSNNNDTPISQLEKDTDWKPTQNQGLIFDYAQCIEEACELLENYKYTCAIIDVGLNHCNVDCNHDPEKKKRELDSKFGYKGIEILTALRSPKTDPAKINKLFVTGFSDTVSPIVDGISKAEIISKSGTYSEVAEVICKWLRKKQFIQ